MKIALDFAPGLHGHFLELITNRYIYDVPFNGEHIFQSSGAVHAINVDSEYQQNKLVHRGHYSSFNHKYSSDTAQVIFIKHSVDLDFVLLTNVYYRCHPDSINVTDFNVEEITEFHRKFTKSGSDLDLRNNWFTKLSEHHFEHASMMPITKLPIHYFNYKSFFNLDAFCDELQLTAKFLGQTFKFDASLGVIWEEFIKRNQGWSLYQQGNDLLKITLTGKDNPILDDWKLHAYLNYRLSLMFNLHDGSLFDNERYPTTTVELLSVIQTHLHDFDLKW